MIPDGVYVNLHPDIYRADPALGSTDHKELLTEAVQWHGRRRNKALCEALELDQEKDPQKAAKRVAGKEYGAAFDVMLLDGEERFNDLYADDIERPDDLPQSKEEMALALREVGVSPPPTRSPSAPWTRSLGRMPGRRTSSRSAWEDASSSSRRGRHGSRPARIG